ncbi:uncharacterized protein LOC133777471 [Humulus lupulus]|uniref:uncharacterized protein LOC133777471 n=1 Tax=Humulus lupulus TaxID=3486 RepID=UPI002B417B67|nr:uncharacterized protein LOC133777471 [Humulus lupulus]
MPKKSFYDSSTGGDSPNYYQQQLHSDYRTQATTSKGPLVKQYQQPRRGHHDNHELSEEHISVSRYKHDREYCSRSPRHVRSSECPRRPREQDEMDGIKHHESKHSSSRLSKHHDNRSSRSLKHSDYRSKSKDRRHRERYENHSSEPLSRFEDRYNPLESHDTHEDGNSSISKYYGSDKFHDEEN